MINPAQLKHEISVLKYKLAVALLQKDYEFYASNIGELNRMEETYKHYLVQNISVEKLESFVRSISYI